jgi:hypothetical protein
MDLDRAAHRARVHRVFVVVEVDRAGLSRPRLAARGAIEATAIADKLRPLRRRPGWRTNWPSSASIASASKPPAATNAAWSRICAPPA